MSDLSAEKQDELIRAVIAPDDSCVHNFAPAFALIAGWLAEARGDALRAGVERLAERYENTSPDNWSRPDVVVANLRRLLDETRPIPPGGSDE